MAALETLGYFSDEPGSQEFPRPFNLVYPDTGIVVAFVGHLGSRQGTRRIPAHDRISLDSRRRRRILEGIDLSDH